MPAKNRLSISFSDRAMATLERLALHQQVSKAEIARNILEKFIADHPNEFRLKTSNFSKSEVEGRISATKLGSRNRD